MQDQKINIAIGRSAKSKIWKNSSMLWSEFVERLKTPHHTIKKIKNKF